MLKRLWTWLNADRVMSEEDTTMLFRVMAIVGFVLMLLVIISDI